MLCDIMVAVETTEESESGWGEVTYSMENAFTDVPCEVRGVIDGGLRLAGTTQNFDDVYENVDWVKCKFPTGYRVQNDMVITNIRSLDGELIWRDEENEQQNEDGTYEVLPTQFDIRGVTPTVDAFAQKIDQHVLAKRVEVRHG